MYTVDCLPMFLYKYIKDPLFFCFGLFVLTASELLRKILYFFAFFFSSIWKQLWKNAVTNESPQNVEVK